MYLPTAEEIEACCRVFRQKRLDRPTYYEPRPAQLPSYVPPVAKRKKRREEEPEVKTFDHPDIRP